MANIFTCKMCGKEFKRARTKAVHCSIKCKADYQRTQIGENNPKWTGGNRIKVCQYCGKEFTHKVLPILLKRKFCSKKCADRGGLRYHGEDHPCWKGGREEIRALRSSLEHRAWSENVMRRDNYTCRECGKRGGDLHAHHILSFADHPESRWDLDNGLTMCVECHKKTYKFYHKPHRVNLVAIAVNSVDNLNGQYRAKPEREGVEVRGEIIPINAALVLAN